MVRIGRGDRRRRRPGSGSATAGDVLIEAYLPGREFNVGVLALPEPEALPVAEIVYDVPDGVVADPDL